MKLDESEKIRYFINMQYVKMKRMSAVGSLILLAINLAFSIYPYIEHRFNSHFFGLPSAYVAVPIVFISVMFFFWLGSHIYTTKMEMYRTEKQAEIILNPYQVYAIQPFWEMWWRDIYIPQMKSQLSTLLYLKTMEEKKSTETTETQEYHNLSEAISYLDNEIIKVQNWLDLGYIPKKDFPQHLKKYYITKKEQRL